MAYNYNKECFMPERRKWPTETRGFSFVSNLLTQKVI